MMHEPAVASSDAVTRSCVWGIFSVASTRTRRSVNSLQIGGVHALNEGIVNLSPQQTLLFFPLGATRPIDPRPSIPNSSCPASIKERRCAQHYSEGSDPPGATEKRCPQQTETHGPAGPEGTTLISRGRTSIQEDILPGTFCISTRLARDSARQPENRHHAQKPPL